MQQEPWLLIVIKIEERKLINARVALKVKGTFASTDREAVGGKKWMGGGREVEVIFSKKQGLDTASAKMPWEKIEGKRMGL